MFESEALEQLYAGSKSISISPVILAEWNLNDPENIETVGCYTNEGRGLTSRYDSADSALAYKNNLVSKRLTDDDADDDLFYSAQKKLGLYYSLEDCFAPNRPRSGINKAIYFSGRLIDNLRSADRPRYYLASAQDQFKYWTSYTNTLSKGERGISSVLPIAEGHKITDAAPFVVYSEPVATNKIVVKMQTNIGTYTLGDNDPLADPANATTPVKWRIEWLDENNNWIPAIAFNQLSKRNDGSPIVPADGQVEITYGILPPVDYDDTFVLFDYIVNEAALPVEGLSVGEAYLDTTNETVYIWNNEEWIPYPARYGFRLKQNEYDFLHVAEQIADPLTYVKEGRTEYREAIYINGLRVVVDTMLNGGSTFDLIELSPRLVASITNSVAAYDVQKESNSGTDLPFDVIKAGTGSIELFNGDLAFTSTGGSLVANALYRHTKIYLYEGIFLENQWQYVPIKTMYVDGWPQPGDIKEMLKVNLRDAIIFFEGPKTPELFRQNCTFTGAISLLLDSIGFSNYVFIGFDSNNDPLIPFFFTDSNKTVAETLSDLCRSMQILFFIDEYNNVTFVHNATAFTADSVYSLVSNNAGIENIEGINARTLSILNAGTIKYTERYVQREVRNIKQAGSIDELRQWVYRPVMLWEVSPGEQIKTKNANTEQSSGYALSAMPLGENLGTEIPRVVVIGGMPQIINNIINVGASIYWIARYEGYFNVNGEIIRYDAVEFSVPGIADTVWITDNEQYQQYFSTLPFNGKIYPTGRIRIYAKPYYDDNGIMLGGAVEEHGRGMFNTAIQSHYAGLRPYWSDSANVKVIQQDTSLLLAGKMFTNPVPVYEVPDEPGPELPPDPGTVPYAPTGIAAQWTIPSGSYIPSSAAQVYQVGYVNKTFKIIWQPPASQNGPAPSGFVITRTLNDLNGGGISSSWCSTSVTNIYVSNTWRYGSYLNVNIFTAEEIALQKQQNDITKMMQIFLDLNPIKWTIKIHAINSNGTGVGGSIII